MWFWWARRGADGTCRGGGLRRGRRGDRCRCGMLSRRGVGDSVLIADLRVVETGVYCPSVIYGMWENWVDI